MKITADITINGSREDVWKVITDIENSPNAISGIDKIEVLEKPSSGIVGLKWEETRTLFGRRATETMWITAAEEFKSYQTRAGGAGAVYETSLVLSSEGDKTRLTMEFGSEPQTFGARILAATIGRMFLKATRQAILQDLADIKAAVEAAGND